MFNMEKQLDTFIECKRCGQTSTKEVYSENGGCPFCGKLTGRDVVRIRSEKYWGDD